MRFLNCNAGGASIQPTGTQPRYVVREEKGEIKHIDSFKVKTSQDEKAGRPTYFNVRKGSNEYPHGTVTLETLNGNLDKFRDPDRRAIVALYNTCKEKGINPKNVICSEIHDVAGGRRELVATRRTNGDLQQPEANIDPNAQPGTVVTAKGLKYEDTGELVKPDPRVYCFEIPDGPYKGKYAMSNIVRVTNGIPSREAICLWKVEQNGGLTRVEWLDRDPITNGVIGAQVDSQGKILNAPISGRYASIWEAGIVSINKQNPSVGRPNGNGSSFTYDDIVFINSFRYYHYTAGENIDTSNLAFSAGEVPRNTTAAR